MQPKSLADVEIIATNIPCAESMTDNFLEDKNAEKLIAPANPAFGGRNLDELYSAKHLNNCL